MKLRHTAITALAAFGARHAVAQTVDLTDSTGVTFVKGSRTVAVDESPTGTYATYTSKITLKAVTDTDTVTISGGTTYSRSSTLTGVFTSETLTTAANVTDGTQTTTTAVKPTNTQPCNGYVELCTRKYSNVTVVGCHNSPFVRPGNSGSNQELDVTTQLNDGIRFLQAQIQWPSNSSAPHFCHTSCNLLDAGPITDWLTTVRKWVDDHPYDVVTILLGNGNYSKPQYYAPYIQQTGILKYAYSPPYLPMEYDDWPTLEQLIVRGKRVIMFMDYEANQTAYPWLLDEFSQVWETPFDPTDRAFPCDAQRPPNLSKKSGANRLYLMNHNLNAEFNVFGTELLVPAVSLLNETNNYTGYGSLGLAANNCRSAWGHPPNFLNVDYYNYGGFPGSVFEAAARLNNVTYQRGTCCGTTSAAVARFVAGGSASLVVLMASLISAYLAM